MAKETNPSNAPNSGKASPSSVEAIYRRLRDWIADGTFKEGQTLPKIAFLVRQEHVSNHTVIQAYARLHAERRIHRRGKSWVLGLAQSRPSTGWTSNPQVILILVPTARAWVNLYRPRTENFCRTFTTEAEQWNIQLILVPIAEGPEGGASPGDKKKQIRSRIRELGARYLGALIAVGRGEIPDFDTWVEVLAKPGKPVVWFDRYDEGYGEAKGEAAGAKFRSPRRFVDLPVARCHFDESRAVACALAHLHEAGHRKLLFQMNEQPWSRNRHRLLCEASARLPDMEPVEAWPDPRLDIRGRSGPQLASWLETQMRSLPGSSFPASGRTVLPTLLQKLKVVDTPNAELRKELVLWLFKRKLQSSAVTGLIFSNDYDAASLYPLFEEGRAVGAHRFSFLSFDNYLYLRPLPISTVDFGFGYLGYQAFHFLRGDVGVKRDKQGDIPAMPRVVNKGSVNEPHPHPSRKKP